MYRQFLAVHVFFVVQIFAARQKEDHYHPAMYI